MDLTPFKKDIDELLWDFAKEELMGFAEMKQLWLSRKFSYIFERRPKGNSAVFMQGLYAHCIGELKKLKCLVVDAKKNGIALVSSLVKRMLANNMFLFGFVDIFGASVAQMIDEITKLQDRRAQIAYDKLLADTNLDSYLHMNLDAEVELAELKKMSSEYAKIKQQAIAAVGKETDVEDVKHISDKEDPIGDKVQEIVDAWNSHKQGFCKQAGVAPPKQFVAIEPAGSDEAEDVDFSRELENLLE